MGFYVSEGHNLLRYLRNLFEYDTCVSPAARADLSAVVAQTSACVRVKPVVQRVNDLGCEKHEVVAQNEP